MENIISDFGRWYCEAKAIGGTKGSSSSYKSYVRCAIREAEIDFKAITQKHTFSECLLFVLSHQKEESLRALIFAFWESCLEQKTNDAQKYKDYLSGIRAFFVYVEDSFVSSNCDLFYLQKIKIEKESKEAIAKALNESLQIIVYPQKNLISTFKLRLNTQDRVYEDVIYPARLLSKIFNTEKEYKSIYEQEIKKLIFKTKLILNKEKTQTINFSQVKNLTLDNKNQKIKVDDKTVLYSGYADEKLPAKEFYAKSIADVSLDHDEPLKNLYSMHKADYKYLYELSDLIKTAACCYDTTVLRKNVRAWTKAVYESKKEVLTTKEYIENLLQDVKKLFDAIRMTLMERKENSKKSDNY